MTERDRTAAFVEDVLARAGVPSRREREDVRRELLTHFEDTVREGAVFVGEVPDQGRQVRYLAF